MNLPYLDGKITFGGETYRGERKPKAVKGGSSNSGFGFVPNFSMDAISSAIQREDRSGVRRDKIRVGYDARLKKSGGIGVYNTDEGSLANAIDMHLASGRNMTALQTQGKAEGFVPNFATSITPLLDQLTGTKLTPTISKLNQEVNKSSVSFEKMKAGIRASQDARKKNTEATKKSTDQTEKGIGTLIGLTVLGGQISSFGSQLKESEVSAVKFGGTLLETAGMATSWAVTADTVFEIFGVQGRSLGEKFINLSNTIKKGSVVGALGRFTTALRTATVGTLVFGKGGNLKSAFGAFQAGRQIPTGTGAFGRGATKAASLVLPWRYYIGPQRACWGWWIGWRV